MLNRHTCGDLFQDHFWDEAEFNHFSHISISNVFSVHEEVFFSQGLHDALASLDVSMKDFNRFPVNFRRLDFINVVLGKS